MKAVVTLALLALAGTISVQAQSDRLHYRVEAGIGASSVSVSGGGSLLGGGFSSRLGGAVEFVLSQNPKGEFYLAPGVEYRHTDWLSLTLNFVGHPFPIIPIFGAQHIKTSRISIPLSAGYRFKFWQKSALSLEGGLLGSYGFSASHDIYRLGILNRFDLGLRGSVAYTFWRFSLGFQINYGLTDSSRLPSLYAHSLDAFYTLGFRF